MIVSPEDPHWTSLKAWLEKNWPNIAAPAAGILAVALIANLIQILGGALQ